MATIGKGRYYTIGATRYAGDFNGIAHWRDVNQRPTDVAVIPPAGVTNALGERPGTSIFFNWDGEASSPYTDNAYPAFGVGTSHRAEKAMGDEVSLGAGVYFLDFWILFTANTKDSLNGDNNWNYIYQHRSNKDEIGGDSPSPSPAIGLMDGQLIFVWRTPTNDKSRNLGSLDKGGSWHRYTIGYNWTTAGTGWVQAFRDGVEVLTVGSNPGRTALTTSFGHSQRFGGYREPSLVGRTSYYLWGLTLHNSLPSGGTNPDPETPPTTRPDLALPSEAAFPAAQRFGVAPATSGATWLASAADKIRGTLVTIPACESEEVWIPLRGSLTGSGTQPHKAVIYSVSNVNTPTTDVKVVETGAVNVASTDEATYAVCGFTRRAFTAGTYRICLHGGANPVGEYLRNPQGGLAWANDTYADGAASTFGAQGSNGIDTVSLVAWMRCEPAAPPPSGPIPLAAASRILGTTLDGNATELGDRTPIPAGNVVYRLQGPRNEYIIPIPYDVTTDAELVWDEADEAYYQIDAPPGG